MIHQLSREQQRIVVADSGPSFWLPFNLLDVRLPNVPRWIEDLYVDFYPGYGNSPSVKIWSTKRPFYDLLNPSTPIWDYENGFYIARLPDGRALAYAAGPLSIQKVGECETWATPQEQGFAGRHFNITMRDGRRAILRGPWHATPPSYEGITLVEPMGIVKTPKDVVWHSRGGTFGLFLPQLHLVAAIHKFHHDLLFADVTLDDIRSLDPYRKEWGKPKAAMSNAERTKWSL